MQAVTLIIIFTLPSPPFSLSLSLYVKVLSTKYLRIINQDGNIKNFKILSKYQEK